MRVHKTILFIALLLFGAFVSGCGPNFWGEQPVQTDFTPPTVSSTNPANSATGTPINQKIAVTFSEMMDPATITTSTISLKQGTTAVPCTVTYVGTIATLKPTSNLVISTTYTATVTTGVKDLAGNAMAAAKTWSFITGTSTDTSAPTVSSTVPADLATGVSINQQVSATFSKAMDAATITTTTFTLMQGTTVVPCTVTYVGTIAILKPTSNLAINTTYTATISTGALDLAGNAMAAAKTWSFTTGTTTDTSAPTVSSTIPADLATGVSIGSDVTAVFSKAMQASTINTATFTLTDGTTTVPGVVTYSGTTAIFSPTGGLAYNTIYVATITTGAKDLAGNVLAANKTWSFKTAAAGASAGPAPVNLGTASNFVILSKSGISSTGTTKITGDIGVSPIDRTAITGNFALIMDSSNQFSTSVLVIGKVYASDYSVPTPANMTAAISDMETAYTDAAGRATAPVIELGAGDIGGMTLAPGLYKWSTDLSIPTDVTLSGGANDVWIFQIAQKLTLSSGIHVNLTGGAQAKNVYWQIAGNTTLGTGSVMKGNLICQTLIAMNTGSTLIGRLLAQTAVTLDAAIVTLP